MGLTEVFDSSILELNNIKYMRIIFIFNSPRPMKVMHVNDFDEENIFDP